MVQVWYMDDSDEDQRLDHHLSPPKYCSLEELKSSTGVLYWKVRDPFGYFKQINFFLSSYLIRL